MKYVGIAAYSGSPSPKLVNAAKHFIKRLGELLSPSETAIVVGGYWGLMRYVVDEALARDFKVVILPPLEREGIEYPRNALVVKTGVSYRVRSVFLVRTSDVLVVLGGGGGSIQEAVTAYTECKPVFVLAETGMDTDKLKHFSPYINGRMCSEVFLIKEPEELAESVVKALGDGNGVRYSS